MSHGAPARQRRAVEDSEEDDEDRTEGPPPPDGGWGWAVTFGSFMIHIITDGVTYSFGVFYDEFLKYFQEGKAKTSWILSILVGVTLCSGPISSAFVNKYGCRAVTIAGAILASACMLLSVFAQNVITLYLTIGVGTGFGFGLIYLPAIVSVTTYFEKYRSLATGIAVCGSGFGTFIFAPIVELLKEEFGWRGALMIISALVLNCIIFGALFRPLEWEVRKSVRPSRSSATSATLAITPGPESQNGHALRNSPALTDVHLSAEHLGARNGDATAGIQRPHSIGHFSLTRSLKVPMEKNGNAPPVSGGKIRQGDAARLALSQPLLTFSGSDSKRFSYGSQNLRRPGPLGRRDIFYQGSLYNIPQYRSKSEMRLGADSSDPLERQRRLSIYSHGRVRVPTTRRCFGLLSEETADMLKEMMDISILTDPIFIVFTASNFCTSIGFSVPYVYIVSKAKDMNISSTDASLLISVIGIANTVGRIILGYVSDKPWINRLWVYNICLTVCGLSTAFSAFCLDFNSLAVYCSVFGFTVGAYVGLTSVILVDLLGLDKLTNAFGLLLLFQGIASLIGPPITGWLWDVTGSYDPGFYFSGLMIAVSGLMLFCIPYLQKRIAKNKHKIVTEEDI